MLKEKGESEQNYRDINVGTIQKFLAPGPFLAGLTRSTIQKLSTSIGLLGFQKKPHNLFACIRHHTTLAATGAVYGPQNPFLDPVIETSWWDFMPGIVKLLFGFFPSIMAWRNLRARARVAAAFKEYFANNGHVEASSLVKTMFEVNTTYGFELAEIAKMEIATCLALLSTSAIATFWTIFHLYANPIALADGRHDILAAIVGEKRNADGKLVRTVDLSLIKEKCPVLYSTFQETLRYHSSVISAKLVLEDMVLADQHYLKKGSTLMIPGPVVHSDTSIWGANANQFDHKRFMRNRVDTSAPNASAFRAFGGGATMCPGRYLSSNVIPALAAMIILQFDIAPISGRWVMPTTTKADIWNALPKPDYDIKVAVTPRKEAENVEWKFHWGISEEGHELSL
ncbi:cytochrome P450 [Zopfia rhizophila CBS 207.26]|uniref:Cytochrome P450 n=1 Tax=Zopfia rhizophila CBS 207.26 TaxID=1314779 RepID=A0A6A6EP72_9PEZI|nr:cytochrome P450 [Zopfia rhizophila CBS 207.26]